MGEPTEGSIEELLAKLEGPETEFEQTDIEHIAERLGWSCRTVEPELIHTLADKVRANTRFGSVSVEPAEAERMLREISGQKGVAVFERNWEAPDETQAANAAKAVGASLREGLGDFPGPHLYTVSNLDSVVSVRIFGRLRASSPATMGGLAVAEGMLQECAVKASVRKVRMERAEELRVEKSERDLLEDNPGIRYMLERSGVPARQVIRETYAFLETQMEDGEPIPTLDVEHIRELIRKADTKIDWLNMCTDEVRQDAATREFLNGINPNFRKQAILILKAVKDARTFEAAGITSGPDAAIS